MPFVNLETIKPFISRNIHLALANSQKFEEYENSVAMKIRDATGYPIPEELEDAPDWVDSIAAWLIEYEAMVLIPDNSEAEVTRIMNNYKNGLNLLKNYRYNEYQPEKNNPSADCGEFTKEDIW